MESDSPANVHPIRAAALPPVRRPMVAGPSLPLNRSSVERAPSGLAARTVDVLAGQLANVDPIVPNRYLALLSAFAVLHPELSQAVKLVLANMNRGHDVVVDAADGKDGDIAAAEAYLAQYAERICPEGGGLDDAINHLGWQLVVNGAVSAEDVLSADRRKVQRLALVPVQDIEFVFAGEAWAACQITGRGRKWLDPRTYQYLAWLRAESNPYGLPPFVAAINPILRGRDMDEQLDAVLRKFGVLGLLMLKVKRDVGHYRDDMDAAELMREDAARLQEVADAAEGNFRKGIVTTWDDIEAVYEAQPAQSAQGVGELLRQNEERLFSGIGLDPSLFGRQWARTETYLGVVRSLLEAESKAFGRIVSARLGRSLNLEMALRAVPVSVRLELESMPELRPQDKAAYDSANFDLILKQMTVGVIDADEGARLAGYDFWKDPSRIPGVEGSGFHLHSLWAVVKEMVGEGAISPDQAVGMLNLPGTWFDPAKIGSTSAPLGGVAFSAVKSHRFRHDRATGRYRHVTPRATTLEEILGPAKAATLRRRAAITALGTRSRAYDEPAAPGPELIQRPDASLKTLVETFTRRYAGRIRQPLAELQYLMLEDLNRAMREADPGDFVRADGSFDEDAFGRFAVAALTDSFRARWTGAGIGDEVTSRVLEVHGEMYGPWREKDRSIWAGSRMPEAARDTSGAADTEAIRALANGDRFHMSVYLEDLEGAERGSLEKAISTEFLAAGRDIHDPDTLEDFLMRLEGGGQLLLRRRDHGREGGEASETDAEAWESLGYRVQRIVNTSVMRSRNTSAVFGMEAAGFAEAEFVARRPHDDRISDVCKSMDGRRIAIPGVAERLRAFHALPAAEQEQYLHDNRLDEEVVANAIASGDLAGLAPPLHPNCRSRLRVVTS